MTEGSAPLQNSRHEAYAVARSAGATGADAWATTFPKDARIPSANSNKVTASRTETRKEVSARIGFLTRQRRAAEARAAAEIPAFDRIDQKTLVALSLEITEVLESALDAAATSSISSTSLARLKGVLSGHLARQGKLSEEHPEILDDGQGANAIDNFNRIRFCECQTR